MNEQNIGDDLLAIGVDGAPGGWVAAAAFGSAHASGKAPAARPGRSELNFFPDVGALAEWRESQPAGELAPVAIDIPIGLPEETEYRACDVAARDRLPKGREGAVFMPPGRYLLAAAETIDERIPTANEVFERVRALVDQHRQSAAEGATRSGEAPAKVRGYSRQGAGILLKVAEVDSFLRHDGRTDQRSLRQEWLFEVHPEMCFRAMNGGVVPPPKASAHGQLQRLGLVTERFPDADERMRSWAGGARYSLVDVCDAYAALWTALRWARHKAGAARDDLDPPLEVLGEGPTRQSPIEQPTGLVMRMVV